MNNLVLWMWHVANHFFLTVAGGSKVFTVHESRSSAAASEQEIEKGIGLYPA